MNTVYPLPKLQLLENGLFELTEDYQSILDVDEIKKEITYVLIKKGVRTNFASIPAIGRALVSPIDSTICRAALTHDFLVNEFTREQAIIYIVRDTTDITSVLVGQEYDMYISWQQAAACLRKIMQVDGASIWKRQVVYWSVRGYGIVSGKR